MTACTREVQTWQKYWEKRWDRSPDYPIGVSGYSTGDRVFDEKRIDAWAYDIETKLVLNKEDVLLDAGCGGGLFIKRFLPKVSKIIGIDFSYRSLEYVNKYIKSSASDLEILQGEAGYLPFINEQFDKTLCYSVFLSFPNYDYAKRVLDELLRVTKKGGTILVGDVIHHDLWLHEIAYYDTSNYAKKILVRFIKKEARYLRDLLYILGLKKYRSEYLYFKPSFFQHYLNGKATCKIEKQNIDLKFKKTAKSRFDVLIKKL